ncbi:MAG: acyl carrier protein [Lachnospiraceae bacterium]|nr:acyl carrier protein [Lachnospiraceae bacterium]
MRDKIISFVTERYGWTEKEFVEGSSFDDLGLDSLSIYSLVTDAEEEFGIKIETDDMTELDTPQKFVDYLMRCIEDADKAGK